MEKLVKSWESHYHEQLELLEQKVPKNYKELIRDYCKLSTENDELRLQISKFNAGWMDGKQQYVGREEKYKAEILRLRAQLEEKNNELKDKDQKLQFSVKKLKEVEAVNKELKVLTTSLKGKNKKQKARIKTQVLSLYNNRKVTYLTLNLK